MQTGSRTPDASSRVVSQNVTHLHGLVTRARRESLAVEIVCDVMDEVIVIRCYAPGNKHVDATVGVTIKETALMEDYLVCR